MCHRSGVMQQKASNLTHNFRFLVQMLANTSACMCVWETCPKRLEGQYDSQNACHHEQETLLEKLHRGSTCEIYSYGERNYAGINQDLMCTRKYMVERLMHWGGISHGLQQS